MKKRCAEVALERANLPADCRLTKAERLAGVRERAGFRGGLEDPELVPVHRVVAPPPWASAYAIMAGEGSSSQTSRDEPAIGLQRRHASEPCGRDGLPIYIIGDVA